MKINFKLINQMPIFSPRQQKTTALMTISSWFICACGIMKGMVIKMKNKRIGNIERALIAECVRDIPSFAKINRLFELGADPNAVNEYGECVLAIIFEGYCSLYGANLRSGFFAPYIVDCFMQNGFDTRRHGLFVISELQNNVYDKHIRRAINIILRERRRLMKKDIRTVGLCIKAISQKVYDKVTA